jgi:hypothetical protein
MENADVREEREVEAEAEAQEKAYRARQAAGDAGTTRSPGSPSSCLSMHASIEYMRLHMCIDECVRAYVRVYAHAPGVGRARWRWL